MNIVIAGAGDVGFHLAELLAIENQNITLIDLDEKLLDYASNHLDVMVIKGNASSINTLKEANVEDAQLFIAATTKETTNLLSAILAKRLGAKKTIARVSEGEYLKEASKVMFLDMGIDNLISPRILAAQEIERLIHRSSVTDIFEFEKGQISIIGFTVDNSSSLVQRSFEELDAQTPHFVIKTLCLLRNGRTIIPDRTMKIERSDHVYLVTNHQDFNELNNFIGKSLREIKRIMIIGGTSLALKTAQVLENKFSITMIVEDEDRCKELLAVLNNVLVINGDWGNLELLKEEGLERMDAFIALTNNSETNIITCITAEQTGVYKTIALVDNSAYTHISQNIGVDTLINKKIIAANNIFRYVRKGKVEAIASMHGVNAEIIEFVVHKNNRVTHVAISKLHLPPKLAKIVGVIRNDRGILPGEDFQLQIGDKVVVFALPEAIKKVESIFR